MKFGMFCANNISRFHKSVKKQETSLEHTAVHRNYDRVLHLFCIKPSVPGILYENNKGEIYARSQTETILPGVFIACISFWKK